MSDMDTRILDIVLDSMVAFDRVNQWPGPSRSVSEVTIDTWLSRLRFQRPEDPRLQVLVRLVCDDFVDLKSRL